MLTEHEVVDLTEKTLLEFCKEFMRQPYLCYTEHGLHALFYSRLYEAFGEDENRYDWFDGFRVCLIQKEYPTHHHLGRSRRQHWDVSVLKSPLQGPGDKPAYDHFRLAAVVEFALNCGRGHLQDDIERLTHPDANLDRGFLVHLYRFSDGAFRVSDRDWNARYKSRLELTAVEEMLKGYPGLYVLYGTVDQSGGSGRGLWKVTSEGADPIPWILTPE